MEATSKQCLNCGEVLLGKFCHRCGQKASTHRINSREFLSHDIPHAFHLDKGILFTLRSLILAPGDAVTSYLAGKRVMHYNIFALLFILVAIKAYLDTKVDYDFVFISQSSPELDVKANAILDGYYKFFYLLGIPFMSILSWLLMQRLGFNYTEHVVMNCFLLTGGFIYALVFSVTGFLIDNRMLPLIGIAALFIYPCVGYYHIMKPHYRLGGYLWRVAAMLVICLLLVVLGFAFILRTVYGGDFQGQFGVPS